MRSVLKSLYLKAFPIFERLGVHVTPVHHTQPVPDTRRLSPRIWSEPSELIGIDMRGEEQRRLLATFVSEFKDEYDRLPRRPSAEGEPRFYLENPFFGPVDAEILYCMIRSERPRRILEVGSGFSTLLSKEALARNVDEGSPGRIDTFDPAPSHALASIADDRVSVNTARAQDIPFETFSRLTAHDILFIDSTHIANIGSDVCYEILEVLPRLRDGVLVHFHDIFLPAEYPRDWVMRDRFFWTEQYLLQAFLAFNDAFRVVWGSSFMHAYDPKAISAAFGSYDPVSKHVGGSLWLRRVS